MNEFITAMIHKKPTICTNFEIRGAVSVSVVSKIIFHQLYQMCSLMFQMLVSEFKYLLISKTGDL